MSSRFREFIEEVRIRHGYEPPPNLVPSQRHSHRPRYRPHYSPMISPWWTMRTMRTQQTRLFLKKVKYEEFGRCPGVRDDALHSEPTKAADVQRQGHAAGITEATLRRAKKRLGVIVGRSGFGPGSAIVWTIDAHFRGRAPMKNGQAPVTDNSSESNGKSLGVIGAHPIGAHLPLSTYGDGEVF